MGERKLSGKPIEMRQADFMRLVNTFTKYDPLMRQDFLTYWTEPDRAPNPKMRFEKEKTWDTGRRLTRWAQNNFGFKGTKTEGAIIHQMHPKKEVKPMLSDIDRLDALLAKYSAAPTKYSIDLIVKNWPSEALTNCYNAIKENKLWDPRITKKDLEGLEERRLKATVIVRTLDYYGCKGFLFSDMIKTRKQLQ